MPTILDVWFSPLTRHLSTMVDRALPMWRSSESSLCSDAQRSAGSLQDSGIQGLKYQNPRLAIAFSPS
eukprot:3335368-Prorocentrum_lima.AAC.1